VAPKKANKKSVNKAGKKSARKPLAPAKKKHRKK
jgi:hypothetical protein